MQSQRLTCSVVLAAVLLGLASSASAHGLVGKRFFPATLTIDDPFVADELSFPTVLHLKQRGSDEGPPARVTDVSAELSKRLSPDLGVSLGSTFRILDPTEGKSVTGFDNAALAIKYVFFKNAEHEMLLSAGVDWDIGGTGSKKIGAESFDTVTPTFFAGKGFGDLPDAVEWLKPFALTSALGVAIPTRPITLHWGFTLQYNLQYLQSFVRDIGLPKPFSRMIPLVEFAAETLLEGPHSGRTTGSVNPGIIWFGRYIQVGIEAVVPINERTGRNVGVLAQLHFYLDDIAPQIFTWTPFHGVLGPTQPR